MPIRIMLADDHKIVRESFRSLLEVDPEFEVVADVGDGMEAVRVALEFKPDVIVMDITMPNLDGPGATRRILSQVPKTRIIALSMHTHHQFVSLMLDAGVSGYVLKSSKARELITAIRMVAGGKTYFSPGITVPSETRRQLQTMAADTSFSCLSDREREVLKLLADGFDTNGIAVKLQVAEKTVSTHREHIMRKLGIFNIAGLTKYAIREGLATLEDRSATS
ncbi:MAG: response regulator transcription factor [bacterium]